MSESDQAPSHYSVLGLDLRASPEQVEKAYRFCMDMYRDGSLATYSLLPPEEKKAQLARIAAAYVVLADPTRRREYDRSQGLASFPQATSAIAPAAVTQSTEPPAPDPADPAALPPIATGGDLKRIRCARGMTLREISVVTKIGVRFLEYIEEDRLAMLPAPVYLRGFLMEYGRMLGLDPRRTAEAYMARLRRP